MVEEGRGREGGGEIRRVGLCGWEVSVDVAKISQGSVELYITSTSLAFKLRDIAKGGWGSEKRERGSGSRERERAESGEREERRESREWRGKREEKKREKLVKH